MTGRDPASDLRRIAFLLERSGASTYRVRAFRNAGTALLRHSAADLAGLAAAGDLTSIPGVGDTTAAVVRESLEGLEPAYLTRLEAENDRPVAEGGAAIRAALRGDLHTHSDWSDGGSPPAEMAWTARELGHAYTALTDHSPRLKVANGLSRARLERQLDVVAAINAQLAPFRVLTGIEVDILEDGTLDQDPDLLARLDVVVASVHSKLAMPAPAMTRRMLTAIANPHTDVLGHCTGRMVRSRIGGGGRAEGGPKGRPESTFDSAAVFAACAEGGVAVEINSRPERLDPPRRLLREAVAAGCVFSIDSDAHAPGQLDWLPHGCARAEACEVPPDRVVNTWELERLLEWTAGHAAG